jgi:hypothetical protein
MQFDQLKRRDFITLLGGAGAGRLRCVRIRTSKVHRVLMNQGAPPR